MDFFRRQNWDLVGRSWIWFTLSGVLLVIGIASWAIFGLNLGIDFTGGGMIRYEFARPIAANRQQQIDVLNRTREALSAVELGHAQVLVGGNDELIIRTPMVENDEEALRQEGVVREQIEKLFAADYGPITPLGRESVGPIVGSQLRQSALHALILGCLLILLYITIRYEFRFAVAAVAALVHDVLLLVGAMAVLRLELDSSFVAVILTVVGFSVHDTIVIFDRIRENMKLHRRANFADTVNASLLQTFARSIYTVLTTLITLAALAVFASGSIRVFAIAMIIGIVLGAYSSIFNASQIVVVWERWRARRKGAAGATTVRRRERAARTVMGSETMVETDGEEEEEEEAAEGAAPRKLSAQEAMARAEELAQEEKRSERRERRKAGKAKGKSKRRF
ncbi:MAG: protein translocase subunit SecF [Armatimonadia bacterium]